MGSKTLLFLASGIIIHVCVANTDFAQCASIFTHGSSSNTSYLDSRGNPAIFEGPLRGFKGNSTERPLVITEQACIDYCGWDPQFHDVVAAFQVLTTWVLPVLGLMGQLPYESLSRKKWRRNAEAFVNWIGAPGAALTTTLWNILTIGECQALPSLWRGNNDSIIKDALYILSCINQYEYPRHAPGHPKPFYRRRDQALLRGILFPYTQSVAIDRSQRQTLQDMAKLLAFHLRLQRRRGVYPIYIGVLWFGVAFGLSIALAFADLGDNSTAHSLALGLLVSWVPIIVFASVVDRNPTSATHCSEMIERWLFNVDCVFRSASLWHAPKTDSTEAEVSAARDQLVPFKIGEFLGQGRRLRYCGVTDTVLKYISEGVAKDGGLPLPEITEQAEANKPQGAKTFHEFQNALKTRPLKWYSVWIASQLIVMTCFGMAFMVSFNTPTVGFGCRSMVYLMWYLLTLPSSIYLLFRQEPWKGLRTLALLLNILPVLAIFVIMLMQTMNGFNSCVCKTSAFGIKGTSTYGGYLDFENAAFYSKYYDVRFWWGVATGVGGGMLVGSLLWLAWKWQKASGLWRVTEDRVMVISTDIPLDMII